MRGNNVVILDDEQNILNSLKRLFRDEPIKVFTTTDYKEALEFIDKEKVKVVLSDHRMPEVSGIEFLTMVKKDHPPIIRMLFTGYLDVGVAEDAINKSGVYRFINKPWNEEELKSAILQGIERFNLQEENLILNEAIKKQNAELIEINTKLKNMYESQRAFTSTVSHELRAPLAAIKTAVDIIISGSAGELTDNQNKFLNKAKINVDRLNCLINDILDLSKLESGKMELNIFPGDLNMLINDVLEIQGPLAEKRKLFIKTELQEDVPFIPFDTDKMNQVINNLVNNAIKFTDQGGVTVRTVLHSDENNVEIIVQDTGRGIEKENMDKLFNKFQQLSDPSQVEVGASGLGLAICKEIIFQHGGKIWAESEPGKYTAFKFLLPLIDRRAREPSSKEDFDDITLDENNQSYFSEIDSLDANRNPEEETNNEEI
ncbi:MAG: hybrid sensor histidine kinase/response regulator [Candidatus Omnitrophica bacterium]|nr:hybrid sensor histidine kinase/response regulator [Candidatus Omnitrophota bacterium]